MGISEPREAPPIAVGVEVAEQALRLAATIGTDRTARRWQTRLPTPPTAEEALDAMNALIATALREGAEWQDDRGGVAVEVAVGVALWDGADAARGATRGMRYASGWDGFPLAARLTERWGRPVSLDAAVNAAALAEARVGAGRGRRSLLYVVLGRSIWSALVLDGAVVRGADGMAGLLAHWRARADGPRCSCGALGHLEPLASAQALVRNCIGRAAATDESTTVLLAAAGGRAEALTAVAVARLAAQGDPAARGVLEDALDGLADALANLVAALDPALIVLGGPLAEAAEDFVAPLRERVDTLCRSFRPPVPLVPSALEPAAAVIGARLLAEEPDEQRTGGTG